MPGKFVKACAASARPSTKGFRSLYTTMLSASLVTRNAFCSVLWKKEKLLAWNVKLTLQFLSSDPIVSDLHFISLWGWKTSSSNTAECQTCSLIWCRSSEASSPASNLLCNYNWSQMPQKSHGFLSLPHKVASSSHEGASSRHPCLQSLWSSQWNTYQSLKRALPPPYTQPQMLSPSTARYHVKFQ